MYNRIHNVDNVDVDIDQGQMWVGHQLSLKGKNVLMGSLFYLRDLSRGSILMDFTLRNNSPSMDTFIPLLLLD